MTQMNSSTKQKETHRQSRLVVTKAAGVGEGWTGSLRLADTNHHIENA